MTEQKILIVSYVVSGGTMDTRPEQYEGNLKAAQAEGWKIVHLTSTVLPSKDVIIAYVTLLLEREATQPRPTARTFKKA